MVELSTYFPPAGSGLELQKPIGASDAGLKSAVTDELAEYFAACPTPGSEQRWALWREGRLVHLEGDFALALDGKA